MTTKPQTVAHRNIHLGFASRVGHVVQITVGIGVVIVDRGGE